MLIVHSMDAGNVYRSCWFCVATGRVDGSRGAHKQGFSSFGQPTCFPHTNTLHGWRVPHKVEVYERQLPSRASSG